MNFWESFIQKKMQNNINRNLQLKLHGSFYCFYHVFWGERGRGDSGFLFLFICGGRG